MTTRLTLLRHGLPEQADRLLGRTDPVLTTTGWQQLRESVSEMAFDAIESSPRQRCCQFAGQLAQQRQLPVRVDDAWAELDFGQWDGVPLSELWRLPGFIAYQDEPFDHTPPGGESMTHLRQRVLTAIERIALTHPNQHLLVVTHSGVIRALLGWLLGQHQGNAHLRRVRLDHAAQLSLELYLDERHRLWPRLCGLTPGPGTKEISQ
ncbi:histidine phosphatase family protein [Ferrimonas balearica]|uniref:histidine phosphatase family protein n=1 Tax=Ferrimonas balearica TaxID=44012 RepID=UPI001F3E58EC|nr:histidine phosphatase family protein [Ferrimonas balearica]MBY6096792.1 histidine phosphatase family protein [Ferrimonas balearica]